MRDTAAEADFRGFCWYPSIDSTDWCHLCMKATGTVDPQGIWCLDGDRWKRHSQRTLGLLHTAGQGTANAADLPAYVFKPGHGQRLVGYQNLMSHWTTGVNRRYLGLHKAYPIYRVHRGPFCFCLQTANQPRRPSALIP